VRDWWQPRLNFRTAPLLPLSFVFGALAALRRGLFRLGIKRTHRLPVPVIVVGNLTVGGAGKTPLVIALAEALRARGFAPGVISRGYGAGAQAPREVTAASDPREVGDEPLLIHRACPVFVARDRPAAGRALLAAHPQVNLIIADDGLQHYALARDVEIAVFDARGAGNGHLMPAGPLREPLSRLSSVDAVVFNGNPSLQVQRPVTRMELEPRGFYQLSNPAQRMLPADFARSFPRVAAVAGIGSPQRFFETLRSLGLHCEPHAFPDHHPYSAEDIRAIKSDVIVMTEKDAIKCASFGDARIWVLPVSARLAPGLIEDILEKLRGPQTA